ncbi:MAG TPA: SCO6880 family protein [Acidimicrobiales bacterium]|nr:SCO6880 family protein [Acidimicrobiales bacterium]
MDDGVRRYTFHPLERRGLLLGLDAAQIATLIGGLVAAVAVGHVLAGPAGVGSAACVLAGSAAGALWPAGGRPLITWARPGAAWLVRRGRGPVLSMTPLEGRGPTAPPVHRGLAPAGLDLVELDPAPGEPAVGVLRDRRSGTWAAVLPVRGRAFSLLDPDQQVQRLEAWRAVLASVARPGSPIKRVQWVARSAPGGVPGPGDRPRVPEAADAAAERAQHSYAELVSALAADTRTQDVWIVVSVEGSRGRPGTNHRPADALRRELRLLQGQLRHADLVPEDPLGPVGLEHSVAALHRPRGRTAGSGRNNPAWPLASEEAWSWYRTDESWHATFWIAEWPRVEVTPDFLTPLLVGGGRRTVSVIMAPVPSSRALREVRSARTADVADARLRDRAGFLPSARREREAEGVARRESELTEGHAEFRFSGYVTISAPDRAELDVLCAEAEHAAQTAHLELRRLHGRQAEAFTWTLPLARGLA